MTNVALIVLDTLRKDYFDERFDWLPGARFENAWSTSHWTVPAHASLFTGLYASEVGSTKKSKRFTYEGTSLVEALSEAGYRTRAFSGNVYMSWHFDYDRGFDEFKGSWRLEQIPEGNVFDWDTFIAETRDRGIERFPLGVWRCISEDCDTVASLRRGLQMKLNDLEIGGGHRDEGGQAGLEYVQELDFGENEFFFMNLMEAHVPYNPPEEYRRGPIPDIDGLGATLGDGPESPEAVRDAYDSEVEYLSDIYRQIFNELREDFDVIFTVGDHGEMLGEHGAWLHWHGIFPEMTHVPLSVYAPNDDFEDSSTQASLLDVHRTIVELTGLDLESKGVDLRSLPDDREFLVEYHGMSPRHLKGLQSRGYDGEKYDVPLEGLVDSTGYYYEHFDGFSGPDEKRERVEALVAELDRTHETGADDVDRRVQKQLEDLGYV